jgi:hypothetical protein
MAKYLFSNAKFYIILTEASFDGGILWIVCGIEVVPLITKPIFMVCFYELYISKFRIASRS